MSPLRWTGASAAALLLATLTGLAAAYFHPEDERQLVFVAFALLTLPAWFGLVMIVLATPESPAHHEDTVESQWVQRASSGAFIDLVIALGVTTAITGIADLRPVDPVVFLVLAMADFGLRHHLLQRRES